MIDVTKTLSIMAERALGAIGRTFSPFVVICRRFVFHGLLCHWICDLLIATLVEYDTDGRKYRRCIVPVASPKDFRENKSAHTATYTTSRLPMLLLDLTPSCRRTKNFDDHVRRG